MEPRCRWIEHAGERVLLEDFSGLAGEEIIALVHECNEFIKGTGAPTGAMLVLVDISGAFADKPSLAAFKESAKEVQPYFKKTAVVGMEGVLKFFAHIVTKFANINATPFDTREQALDWLIDD